MGAKLEFDNTGIASVVSEKSRSELDDIVFASIIDRDLTAPPSAEPTNGDRYIPKATATGDWDGKEDSIMFWHGYWAEIKPTRNMRAWLEDEKVWIEYDGAAWVHVPPALMSGGTKTAAYTILAAENGGVFDNTGASGAVQIDLPDAIRGMNFYFLVNVAQELRIKPATGDQIALPSTGVLGTADKWLTANAVAERVHLICIADTEWQVGDFAGTWTAEA